MRAFLARIRPWGPTVLRLMVGVLAISFAMGKVFHGMGGFYKEVAAWGFSPAVARGVAWGSLVSGFLLLLGLFARLAALCFGAVTALVIWKTRLHAGFPGGGLDLPLLTLVSCLSIFLSGAGRPSFDAEIFRRFSDPG